MQAHQKALQVYSDKMYEVPERIIETHEVPGLGRMDFSMRIIEDLAEFYASINGTMILPPSNSYSNLKTDTLNYGTAVLKSNRDRVNRRMFDLKKIEDRFLERRGSFYNGIIKLIELSDSTIKSGATQ